MLARPTLMKPRDQDDSSTPKGQARPIEKRFLLRVDGQIKTSFDSKEPAARAGAVIKRLFLISIPKSWCKRSKISVTWTLD
jgi:hypothetical protein